MTANLGRLQFGIPVKGKGVRKSIAGRVCRMAGCTTVLSIYNDSEDCSLHELRALKPRRDRI